MSDSNQNAATEAEWNGVKYLFVETLGGCGGCIADGSKLCYDLPHCRAQFRTDKRNGIWVAKEPPQ